MLLFNEGLPRSGKSYSAMVDRIIPALKDGRAVFAHLDGLNHEKIAEASGVSLERVQSLLTYVSAEDVQRIYDVVANNALVIIDEAQDHFPNRDKVSKEMTTFVTQHGHRGLDVVLMGQDLRDVHVLWRRRIEIKQVFLKLSGVGKENSFSVSTQRRAGKADEFTEASFEIRKYEEKYFGTYASHVNDRIQTGNYKEKGATIWGNSVFTKWIPLSIVATVFCLWYLWGVFKGDKLVKTPPPAAVASQPAPVVQAPVPVPSAPTAAVVLPARSSGFVAAAPAAAASDPVEARLSGLSSTAQVRLAGVLRTATRDEGVIEWWDQGSSRVLERMTVSQLRQLGVTVALVDLSSARLTYGGWTAWATMWPVESAGRVSQDRQEQIAGKGA